ncbi:MAG: hypothetical protein MUO31_10815 [Thermodesulfovibrionales bacterium]|nr:hypothetical protein [Thermodesulfovibrionales bacterium]
MFNYIKKHDLRLFYLFLIFVGLLLLYYMVFEINSFHYDDPFITYRYAKNLNSGLGLVYNRGEKVFGTSTPLYAIILAILYKIVNVFIRIDYHSLSQIISLFCFSGALIVLIEVTGVGILESIAFFLLLLFSPVNFNVLFSGMETFTVLLFLLLFLKKIDNQKALIYLIIIFLLRLDIGIIASISFFTFYLFQLILGQINFKRLIKSLIVIALAVLAYTFFTLILFKTFIPQTIIAKTVIYTHSGFSQSFGERVNYVIRMGFPIFVSLPMLLFGLFIVYSLIKKRNVFGLQYFLFLTFYSLFQVSLIGAIQHWYLPYLPFLLVLITALYIKNVLNKKNLILSVVLFIIISLGISSYMFLRNNRSNNPNKIYFKSFKNNLFSDELFMVARMIPVNSKIFCADIGVLGFFSNAYIYDYAGLVSKKAVPYNKKKKFYNKSQSYNISDEMILAQIDSEKPDIIVLRKDYPFVEGILKDIQFRLIYKTYFSGQREIVFRRIAEIKIK